MNTNRILFAGMYDSGKTTFIAALWAYVNSDKKGKQLKLNTLVNSENEYLDTIRAEWLQCKKVTRTNLNKTENVKMNLLNESNSENVILEIPDISGELFSNHFQTREWTVEYDSLVNEINGILLFINPTDKKNRTNFIADSLEIVKELGGTPENNENVNFATWSDEHTSNQVKLVETLQFIETKKDMVTPIKVSVIVSRWDLIEEEGCPSPEKWLQTNMPLLYQYLKCNTNYFKPSYFGVSAQGCDYDNEDDVDRMLEVEPFERPFIRLETEVIKDLTAPIIWLTEK